MTARWKKAGVIFAPVVTLEGREGGNVRARMEGTNALVLLPYDASTGGPNGYSMIQEVTT